MINRLTKRGAISQKDINKLLEFSIDSQFGPNAAYYKLKEYEDLEEEGLLLRVSDTTDSIGKEEKLVHLTKDETASLIDFIEFNIFDVIRDVEEIDDIKWLCNLMSIYKKCKEVQNEKPKI